MSGPIAEDLSLSAVCVSKEAELLSPCISGRSESCGPLSLSAVCLSRVEERLSSFVSGRSEESPIRCSGMAYIQVKQVSLRVTV